MGPALLTIKVIYNIILLGYRGGEGDQAPVIQKGNTSGKEGCIKTVPEVNKPHTYTKGEPYPSVNIYY